MDKNVKSFKYWFAMKLKYLFLLTALSGFTMLARAQSFIVNEVMVGNVDMNIDPSYNYGGWIELYNPTDKSISLSKVYISDDPDNLTKYQMPLLAGSVGAGRFRTIWFDHYSTGNEYSDNSTKQVSFKLNPEGGTLYFSNSDGELFLEQSYPPGIPRVSYARTTDGGPEWRYSSTPTLAASNVKCTFADERLEAPRVSHDATVYRNPFTVTVDIPEGATLRYTTDGTTPTLKNGATSVTGSFKVSGTNRIYRFCLFQDGYLPSPVVTRTYIYQDREWYLPIVSIVTDEDNLYDDTIGAYTDGTNGIDGNNRRNSNKNRDWERPVNFEYILPDETGEYRVMAVNQEVDFEVNGGWSRHFAPASSFKLKTDKRYDGVNYFDFPIFTAKPYTKNKAIVVRNGGNDNNSRIMDAAIHEVLRSSGFYIDCQAWQPSHVFINGVYKFMFNVRETNNKFFANGNYGIDNDEVDQFEINSVQGYAQKAGDNEVFMQWLNLATQLAKEPDNDDIYRQICDIVDIDEYCNYMAAELYIGNDDWPDNNIKAYRSTLDGRFRFVSFDLDYVKNNFSDIITEGTPKGEHQLKWEQPDNTKNEFVGTVTFTDYDDASDGHFTVNIPDFADMIGNNCIGYNESFIIDKTAPKISWKFEDENGVGPDNKYFSGSRKLTVNVEEHNFTLDDIEKTGTGAYLVYSMTSDGTDVAAGSKVIWLDWKENGENKFVGTYEFTDSEELLRDGEYTVVFTSLTDKAGNAAENSDFGKTETFVVDNTDPVITWEYDDHDGNLTTRVEKNSTVYYYDQMRTLKATIKEHNLTADDLNSGDYIDYSIKDEHGNELTLVWSATRNPDVYTASVDLDDLTDDDFDGKYTVVFRSLKDRAQRTAKNSNLGKTESFIIDKTEPVIKVEYLNDNGKWYQTDNDYQYFNDKSNPLTLKVTVTEHNFSADEIEEFISYSIVNEHGESISFDKWNHENGTNVFTAEYVFEDKSNDDTDGDYTVSVDSLNDKVGHKALDTDGAEFTGHSRDRIVIDYTAPVVNVEYDNNNSKTVDGAAYFDKNRTITVTVTDHGIKNAEDLVSLIDFAITSDETGNMVSRKVAADKWQKSGNTYTFKYTFQDTAHMSDGDFVVKFSGFTDPAGNKATDASGSVRDSFIDDRFVIDTTKPVIW